MKDLIAEFQKYSGANVLSSDIQINENGTPSVQLTTSKGEVVIHYNTLTEDAVSKKNIDKRILSKAAIILKAETKKVKIKQTEAKQTLLKKHIELSPSKAKKAILDLVKMQSVGVFPLSIELKSVSGKGVVKNESITVFSVNRKPTLRLNNHNINMDLLVDAITGMFISKTK